MTTRSSIGRLAAGAVVAGAVTFSSLFGGITHADTPSASEVVVSKLMDSPSPALDDGNSDGRDFLIWQRTVGAPTGNAVAVEGITLVHEGFQVAR